jgi:hypothetical protein
MKVIDQTPFFNEQGEISMMDRVKATMKFGNTWIAEVKAQKSVIAILEKVLDRNYTLLCNITPPGLEASIPIILIGPAGIFVLYVTPLTGMFRAKGDQWGTVVGSTFKQEKPNLLYRTERMARAIQVYLQRHGYSDLNGVEAILLCSDPGMHVDSLRPIIRVVMRDALERFAVSLTQARAVISPEAVHNIVNRILHAPSSESSTPPAPTLPTAFNASEQTEAEPYVPAFSIPEEQSESEEWGSEQISRIFGEEAGTSPETIPAFETDTPSQDPFLSTLPDSIEPEEVKPPARKRAGLSRKHWTFLIAGFVIWCLIVAAFAYLVLQDLTF